MKYTTATLLASAGIARASIQGCTGESSLFAGNWYCGAVNHILYSNVGHPGKYKQVTNMADDGSCHTTDASFSGPVAPFDEGLSVHLRGPAVLKQFAVYNLATPSKRSVDGPSAAGHGHGHMHARRHAHNHHQHLHEKPEEALPREEKRDGEVWVTATINGDVVSWINNYFGPTGAPETATPDTPAPAPDAAPTSAPAPASVNNNNVGVPGGPSKASKEGSAPQKSAAVAAAAAGDYTRVGYYHAGQQIADGVTFLGNYGGQGSGVWDYKWGNSLSYLSADGLGGASSPQVLASTQIPSNKEFAIFSDKKCDGDCGYVRPGSVAYHGFTGADKVFLIEFSMPLDPQRRDTFNGDMPALWLLNARIPRTQQYGACSCWPACGEVDVFEVLDSGDTKCKSTVHSNVPGGASDWFARPTGEAVKAAVVFDGAGAAISVRVLSGDVDFGAALSRETVRGWVDGDGNSPLTSVFVVGS